jgi:D-serine dehydratase
MIRELLKDEDYSKGELALLVAGALKEPGGIAEKLDKARELALPVARKRREEDKAITLAAYKLAKEKEQQQIKAGTLPKELILRTS